MRRLSICQYSTSRWSIEEDIANYSSLPAEGIGLWKVKVDDIGAQQTADLLFEQKLRVSSLHWTVGFTGSTGASYVDAVNDAIDSIKVAGMLGAETLVINPGGRNGHTASHAIRILETALAAIVPVAEDYGVRLGLEPVFFAGQCPWTFLNGVHEVLHLVGGFDPVDVGLVLDLFHVGACFDLLDQLPKLMNRIALVQLGDRRDEGMYHGRRCPLGKGILPLDVWISRLEEYGYQGLFEVESWGFATPGQYEKVIRQEVATASHLIDSARKSTSGTRSSSRR